MKKILTYLVSAIFITTIVFVGFSFFKDSSKAQFMSLGKHHIVTLYASDGKEIKTWESTGNISNEQNSDGWYFEDVATGKLVEISGTMIITVK